MRTRYACQPRACVPNITYRVLWHPRLRRGKKPRGQSVVTWSVEEILPRLKCIPMHDPPLDAPPPVDFRPRTAPVPMTARAMRSAPVTSAR